MRIKSQIIPNQFPIKIFKMIIPNFTNLGRFLKTSQENLRNNAVGRPISNSNLDF